MMDKLADEYRPFSYQIPKYRSLAHLQVFDRFLQLLAISTERFF